jgi:hypothetical protein
MVFLVAGLTVFSLRRQLPRKHLIGDSWVSGLVRNNPASCTSILTKYPQMCEQICRNPKYSAKAFGNPEAADAMFYRVVR